MTDIYLAAFVDELITSLMGKEITRQAALTKELVQINREAGGTKYGFLYAGQIYSSLLPKHRRGMSFGPVVSQLEGEAAELRRLAVKLEADERKFRQSMSVVLSKCRSLQDVRDVLPEVVIRDVPKLQELSRIRAEGFLLQDHPVLKRQYDNAVEIAKYYIANRLIYT